MSRFLVAALALAFVPTPEHACLDCLRRAADKLRRHDDDERETRPEPAPTPQDPAPARPDSRDLEQAVQAAVRAELARMGEQLRGPQGERGPAGPPGRLTVRIVDDAGKAIRDINVRVNKDGDGGVLDVRASEIARTNTER